MNVERFRRSRRWRGCRQGCAALIVMGLAAAAGQAAAFPDLPDLLDDPLHVRPPSLNDGARLPGESQPIACPSVPEASHDSLSGTPPELDAPLSLGDVVDQALCRSPQLRLSWAAIRVQANALGEAAAAYLPTLSASTSALHSRTAYPGPPPAAQHNAGQTVYANLAWRLFDFGGRAARHEAADRMLVAAMLSHDEALQTTLAGVVGAYFAALTAEASVIARHGAVRLAEEAVAATGRRTARGAAARSDVLQAQAALAKAQLAWQRAVGEAHKARALLVYAMNLPPSTAVRLPRLPDNPPPGLRREIEHWLAEAAQHHPGILAARAQSEAARAKVAAARAEALPTLDLTGNYYRNGYPNMGLQSTPSDTATWGITLTLPIFDGFASTYKIRGAQAQAEQSAAKLADTERRVFAEVLKAHADTVSSLANLESSAQWLDAARASVASSARRYARGAADILELLNQLSAQGDAEQERIRCLAEWRAARLRLMAYAGVLGSLAVRADPG